MDIRVLVVDDSQFICKRIYEILEQEKGFKVVGMAGNGRDAVRMAATLQPDVITMDIEMPVMDGITAVRKIMSISPTPILMFSSSTYSGAKATLDALDAGAMDFLPKQLNEIDGDREKAKRLLRRRVRIVANQVAKIKAKKKATLSAQPFAVNQIASASQWLDGLRLLTIAASTGGPVAIQKILTQIPECCPVPIMLIQHMPKNFTKSFAERLNQLCKITVKEADDGDFLEPGLALLGPGGMQMEIENKDGRKCIKLREKKTDEIYSPCADITLTSIVQHYSGKTLSIILTGMGADGRLGVEKLKQGRGIVWAQDEHSCTIYGMPKAIIDANLADQVFSLDKIASEFKKIK
jgi:two-component system, chemotaxis family, protein-glutamate methylesterase/glutaminase